MISGIAYDAQGNVAGLYNCPDILSLEMQKPAGGSVYEVPYETIASNPFNFDPLRKMLCDRIDAAAEVARSKFITSSPGQAMTYIAKSAEAIAYRNDNTVPTPFLCAEAAAIGITVNELASEVSHMTFLWELNGSMIEATRRKAKIAVQTAADDVKAIYAASVVEWESLTA